MKTREVSNETLNEISENACLLSGLNELNKLLNAHSQELNSEKLDTAHYFIETMLAKLSGAIKGSIDSVI